LDQFKDENVEVVSSVVDIKDITKNTTSFTRTFTVPASRRNNIIFRHYYDANIDNSFDARTKIDGRIDLDGIPFKYGKFRLSKVSVKKNKPSAYTINFFGNLVDLKDKLKNDELSSLDLSAYDHDYDSDTVRTGLEGSLFSGDLIYNLFVKKQYYINSINTDNTQTEKLANISYLGGNDAGVIWNDLRPSLKLIRIIEAIETKYDIVFSRDFFGTSEFTKLYMWLNPHKEKQTGGDTQIVDFDSGDSTYMNLSTNVGSYTVQNTSASDDRVRFFMALEITPSAGYENVEYTIKMYRDGEVFKETTHTGTATQRSRLDYDGGEITYSVYYEVVCTQKFVYSAELEQRRNSSVPGDPPNQYFFTFASENTIESVFVVSEEVPKMKIIDFLKGLFNMYKLVVIPEDDGTLYINGLNEYYAEGNVYEVTRYIDFESFDVSRGEILNEISFKFSEPTTILNLQFKENTLIAYGDEELRLNDDNGNPLDGDSLAFELPFEQFVYERLPDLQDNVLSQVQYAAIIGEDLSPANPKAHIFYNQNISTITKPIGFIDDDGNKQDLDGFNIPMHVDFVNYPQYSTTFGKEINEWDGSVIQNTLYSNHYQKYIEAIFNIKKRSFNFSAVLPLWLTLKLQLNDVLKIKESYYRIDKYSFNLLNGKTNFDLVNSFDESIGGVVAPRSYYTDYTAKTDTIYVSNLEGATIQKVSQGATIDFLTVTQSGNHLTLTFIENTDPDDRGVYLIITNANNKQTIYINQSGQ
jgi:hypothetical protein